MSDDTTALVLALATENAELRAALAEAQELLIETAVDAGGCMPGLRRCSGSWMWRAQTATPG